MTDMLVICKHNANVENNVLTTYSPVRLVSGAPGRAAVFHSQKDRVYVPLTGIWDSFYLLSVEASHTYFGGCTQNLPDCPCQASSSQNSWPTVSQCELRQKNCICNAAHKLIVPSSTFFPRGPFQKTAAGEQTTKLTSASHYCQQASRSTSPGLLTHKISAVLSETRYYS